MRTCALVVTTHSSLLEFREDFIMASAHPQSNLKMAEVELNQRQQEAEETVRYAQDVLELLTSEEKLQDARSVQSAGRYTGGNPSHPPPTPRVCWVPFIHVHCTVIELIIFWSSISLR